MSLIRFRILLLGACFVLGACASGGGNPPETVAPEPAAPPAPVIPVVEVTARSLNVRQEPVTGAVLGSLAQGERVEAPNEASDGWVYVESQSGLAGWVSTKYVTSVEPEAAEPESAAPEALSSEEPDSGSASEPDYTPAVGGKLAQIQPGMNSSQVVQILGPPTREQNYITGKSFIPFYYGPDASRVDFKYAGVGRVVFTRNRYSGQLKVIRAEEDESETGY